MHSIFSMAHRCMRFINALNRMTNAILAVRMGFLWEFRLFITEQIKWKLYLNTLLKFMMIDTITKETHKHQTEGVNKSSIIFMAFVVQLNRNNKISMTCACTWRYVSIVEFKHGLHGSAGVRIKMKIKINLTRLKSTSSEFEHCKNCVKFIFWPLASVNVLVFSVRQSEQTYLRRWCIDRSYRLFSSLCVCVCVCVCYVWCVCFLPPRKGFQQNLLTHFNSG